MLERQIDIATADGATTTFVAHPERWALPETVEALTASLASAAGRTEVELYPGVEHGFAFPQRAAYDKASAERHWERLVALYRRNLG